MVSAMKSKATNAIPACPENWSEKSKQSVPYQGNFIKEYRDIQYSCWRCQKPSVFSAEDQKYTYEVKKAYIDQKRKFCSDCWQQSNAIAEAIQNCEEKWERSNDKLKSNPEFLSEWLNLLVRRDEYEPYKSNTAIKNMLKKLLLQFA